MFNTTSGYSLADVAAATRGNEGMFGDGAWWIIILFLFCFNGGWGNGFGGNAGADLGYQLDMQTLQNGQTAMAGNLANGFYNLNTGLLTGFGNTNTAMQ